MESRQVEITVELKSRTPLRLLKRDIVEALKERNVGIKILRIKGKGKQLWIFICQNKESQFTQMVIIGILFPEEKRRTWTKNLP